MPRPLNSVKSDISGYKALGHLDAGFGQVTPGDLSNLPVVGPYTIGSAGALSSQSELIPLSYTPAPSSMIGSPLTSPQIAALSYANQQYFGGSSMPIHTTAQSWFSTNWEWLALGGLVGLVLLSLGGRRR